ALAEPFRIGVHVASDIRGADAINAPSARASALGATPTVTTARPPLTVRMPKSVVCACAADAPHRTSKPIANRAITFPRSLTRCYHQLGGFNNDLYSYAILMPGHFKRRRKAWKAPVGSALGLRA